MSEMRTLAMSAGAEKPHESTDSDFGTWLADLPLMGGQDEINYGVAEARWRIAPPCYTTNRGGASPLDPNDPSSTSELSKSARHR